MADGPVILSLIPCLCRFARALTGVQPRGDALVLAALEAIMGNLPAFLISRPPPQMK